MDRACSEEIIFGLRAVLARQGQAEICEGAIAAVRSAGVSTTTQGGVIFEWHVNRWDVRIEFDADGELASFRTEQA